MYNQKNPAKITSTSNILQSSNNGPLANLFPLALLNRGTCSRYLVAA